MVVTARMSPPPMGMLGIDMLETRGQINSLHTRVKSLQARVESRGMMGPPKPFGSKGSTIISPMPPCCKNVSPPPPAMSPLPPVILNKQHAEQQVVSALAAWMVQNSSSANSLPPHVDIQIRKRRSLPPLSVDIPSDGSNIKLPKAMRIA